MQKLYSIEDLSKMLSVKERTVRQWVFLKKIKKTKIGNLVRFKESDVEEFLKGYGAGLEELVDKQD